jgi:transposase
MAQRNRAYSRAGLSLTHPNAAGIDIGSASHYVAVPPDRDDEPVREFASFTADLQRLADWLDGCGVDTVAMESTGVYWIPLYELLDARGFTVLLVNARHVWVANSQYEGIRQFRAVLHMRAAMIRFAPCATS